MKTYFIRFSNITKSIGNYTELTNLLKGDAKNHKIETKIYDNMPVSWHNKIALHNSNLEKSKINKR